MRTCARCGHEESQHNDDEGCTRCGCCLFRGEISKLEAVHYDPTVRRDREARRMLSDDAMFDELLDDD